MSPTRVPRKILSLKGPAPRFVTNIEYRVVWSEIDGHWEIHRNGVKTSACRRKKQSAIDIAILEIKTEGWPAGSKAFVTSLKDKTLKTEWSANGHR
jgi:hypothetical protein